MVDNPNTTTKDIADNINQEGIRMWPSLATASSIHFWANIFLIGALVLGVISTFFIVWMGNIKEEYLNRDIANTMERAAIAEQRAAEANQKAEAERLARVKIEEKIAPRGLSPVQFGNLRNKLIEFAPMAVDICMFPEGSLDIIPLSYDLIHVLQAAKWDVLKFIAIGAGANFRGVWISIHKDSDITVKSAAKLLIDALNSEGIITREHIPFAEEDLPFTYSSDKELHLNGKTHAHIRIMIGTKP